METNKTPQKTSSERGYYALGLRIAADFGVTIAIPALIAAYAGKRLDEHYDTAPWIVVSLLCVALVLTGVVIVRKANAYAKLYEQQNNK